MKNATKNKHIHISCINNITKNFYKLFLMDPLLPSPFSAFILRSTYCSNLARMQRWHRPPQTLQPGGFMGVKEPHMAVKGPTLHRCKRATRKWKGPCR